jgi:DNA-binding MurR/RpiR family transcriptional regulator
VPKETAIREKGAKIPERHNIVQIIRDHYPRLNDTNQKIADFILQHLEKATFSSLLEIAKEIGISDTSLVRFARELGFRGYQDLRENLIDYIRKIIYPTYKSGILVEKGQHPTTDIVMKKDIEYITKTMSNIDIPGFDALIKSIISAKHIYCMGWGCSSFLAEYLAYTLRFFSYEAVPVIRERKPLIQQLLFLEKDDLLITFDLLPYSAEILEAIEYVHGKNIGTRIITITNDPMANVVQYSDLSFFCDMSGHTLKLVSLTAPICFINAIIEQLVEKDAAKTREALNELQRVIQHSPMHYEQFDPQNFRWRIQRGQ